MRKETEIQLILERPHLYLPTILEAYGLPCDAVSMNEFRGRLIFKDQNFFECGEGWRSLVSAFAEGLDQHFGIFESKHSQGQQTEEPPIVLIMGAATYHHRLYLQVETNRVADKAFGTSIEAMKALAISMSSRYCEICGTSAIGEEFEPVRCRVCHAREL